MSMRSYFFLAIFWCLLGASTANAQEAPAPAEAVVEQPADAAAPIRAALARIPELRTIDVQVGDGVATLTGEVPTAEARTAAQTIAEKTEGILWVDNRVTVKESEPAAEDPSAADAAIRERLEGVFANVPELQDVDVKVRSGVVRLEGKVLSTTTAEQAAELAKSIDGVVYVDNAIQEVTAVQERISPALVKAREVITEFVTALPLFAVGLVIFLIFLFLARVATTLEFPYRRLRDKPLIQGIVRQAVRLVVVGAGVLLVLELFDLTALVGAVLGTAGVAGLAIGFAFRDIVENYLASLMLSVRQPFEANDFVKIDTHEGKVVRLSTRETVLMTFDGNHLRIPNAVVFKAIILNYSRNPLRRFDFVVGVGVDEDLVEVLRVGLETLNATPGVLADPKAFGLIEALGDFTVNIRFFAWVDQRTTDFGGAKSAGIRRVKEAFDAHSIDMPEPTQRVLHREWKPPAKQTPAPRAIEPEVEAPMTEQLDEQIARERAKSDERDLLK